MLDWLFGAAMTALIVLTIVVLEFKFTETKPTNEQVAACVISCKGHLTDMREYLPSDVAKDGTFICHCKMAFKISKDGSTVTDLQ